MAGLFRWLFGGDKTQSPTPASGLQLQSSSQGYPIPIVYGANKIAGNMVWYGNFQAIKTDQEVGKGGGTTISSYTYTVGAAFGIGEGAIVASGQAWTVQGKTTIGDLGLTHFDGGASQTPWPWLLTYNANEALNYKNFSYLASSAVDCGSSPVLPQFWFEVGKAATGVQYFQANNNYLPYTMFWCSALNEFWVTSDAGFNGISIQRINPNDGSSNGTITYQVGGVDAEPNWIREDPSTGNMWIGSGSTGGAYTATCIDPVTQVVVNQWTMTTGYNYQDFFFTSDGQMWSLYFSGYPPGGTGLDLATWNKTTGTRTSHTTSFTNRSGPGVYFDNDWRTQGQDDDNGNLWFVNWATSTPNYTLDNFWTINITTKAITQRFNVPTVSMAGVGYANTSVWPFYDTTRQAWWTFFGDPTNNAYRIYRIPITTYLPDFSFSIDLDNGTGTISGFLSGYDPNRDWVWQTSDVMVPNVWYAHDMTTGNLVFSYTNYRGNPLVGYDAISNYPYQYQFCYWDEPANVGDGAIAKLTVGSGGNEWPANVVYDFLTNPRYGAKFPATAIDMSSLFSDPSSFDKYTKAQNIEFALAISQASAARDYIQRWLDTLNTACFWSGEQIKFAPWSDQNYTGNGVNFVPVTTIRYALTDDDFLGEGNEEPIKIRRADTYDCHNTYRFKFTDQANEYNIGVVEAKDEASIQLIGERTANPIDAAHIVDVTTARTMCEVWKNRHLYIRNTYTFRLSWEYALLEPMDLVTLTQADLGLNAAPVRIVSVEEDEDGILTFEAVDYLAGVIDSAPLVAQGGEPTPVNNLNPPTDMVHYVIMEPPSGMTSNRNQAWIQATGDPRYVGGFVVWVSLDGISYANIGTTLRSTIGVYGYLISAPLGYLNPFYGTNPDTASLIDDVDVIVSGSQVSGVFPNSDPINAAAGVPLIYIDQTQEFMSYETSTLTSFGHYELQTFYRNWQNRYPGRSVNQSLTNVALVSQNALRYSIPDSLNNADTIYIKFQAFNPTGTVFQDVSMLTAYSYIVQKVGRNATQFITGSYTGTFTPGQVIWTHTATADYHFLRDFGGCWYEFGPTVPTVGGILDLELRINGIGVQTLSYRGSIYAPGGWYITSVGNTTSCQSGDTIAVVVTANTTSPAAADLIWKHGYVVA